MYVYLVDGTVIKAHSIKTALYGESCGYVYIEFLGLKSVIELPKDSLARSASVCLENETLKFEVHYDKVDEIRSNKRIKFKKVFDEGGDDEAI